MAWRQLILQLRAEELPQAEALLELAGAAALSIGDAADHPLLEPGPGELPMWPAIELRALFRDDVDVPGLASIMDRNLHLAQRPTCQVVRDQDWIDSWRERMRPLEFGSTLAVLPADAPLAAPRQLRLHMGLAFGTGQHPTTALCLEWLTRQRLDDRTVLDFGCGSGILALAALKLGAVRAFACDNDPQALTATADNARLNDLEHAVWIGDPQSLPPIKADVILANLVAGTLMTCRERFGALAAERASLVMSGILAEQTADVECAFAAHFADFRRAERDGWVCLVGQRKRA